MSVEYYPSRFQRDVEAFMSNCYAGTLTVRLPAEYSRQSLLNDLVQVHNRNYRENGAEVHLSVTTLNDDTIFLTKGDGFVHAGADHSHVLKVIKKVESAVVRNLQWSSAGASNVGYSCETRGPVITNTAAGDSGITIASSGTIKVTIEK